MKENKQVLSCEICKGQFCPSYEIAGPCIPVLIEVKEKTNE